MLVRLPLPRRVLALVAALSCLLSAAPSWCATITIINADQPGEGFNDPTTVAPTGGNLGVTRGAQALNAFQYAADVLGALLYSDVEVLVTARFMPRDGIGQPLLDCGNNWAVLGAASPDWVCIADAINDHPDTNLWYPGALCNRLTGERLEDGLGDPYSSDISADFNGRIGSAGCMSSSGWYFGFDAHSQNDEIDLVSVVLHELSHGLGFLTYATIDGTPLGGVPDVFMAYTYDNDQSRYWYQMTNNQRATSSENTLDVVWRGPRTVAAAASYMTIGADSNNRPRLYTPGDYEPGSSVSHFTNAAEPNLLMEPSISLSLDHTVNGIDITLPFLQDIGWRDPGCSNGILEAAEDCDDGARNSDTTPDACRSDCTAPSCGDGVTDSGEDCDDGAQNSTAAGHCRPGCLDFQCGDGIVDTGEDCDLGVANANQPNTCRLNCNNPSCGDDIVDTGEQCDDGLDNGDEPDGCRADCELPSCGDGVIDSAEACDDGAQNADVPGACQLDCTTTCGDGVVDPGEECDDAAANGAAPDACRSNCLEPACGDGIIDSVEACDDHNTTAGDGCDGSCQLETVQLPDAGAVGGSGGSANEGGAGSAGIGPDASTPVAGGAADSGTSGGAAGAHSVSPDETAGRSNASGTDDGEGTVIRGVCGCRTQGAKQPGNAALWLVLGLGLLLHRRRAPGASAER